MNARELALLMGGDGKASGEKNQYHVKCPIHTDTKPSVDLMDGAKGVIAVCRAGCDKQQLKEAIFQKTGVDIREKQDRTVTINGNMAKFTENRWYPLDWGTATTEYKYRNEEGKHIYSVVRFVPKTFRRGQWLSSGKWKWKLEGDTELIPYRLPELRAALKRGEPVFVVEGEKDADNGADRFKVCTTTFPGGAKKPWQPSYTAAFQLEGTTPKVVIIADNDKKNGVNPGVEHAENVASRLSEIGCECRIVVFEQAKDLTEFIDAGGTREQLRDLIAASKVWKQPEIQKDDLWAAAGNQDHARDPQQSDRVTQGGRPHWGYLYWTDSANAERFKHYYGENVRSTPERGFYIWDSRRWKFDNLKQVNEMAKDIARKILNEEAPVTPHHERDELNKFAYKTSNRQGQTNLIELAKSLPGIAASINDLDPESSDDLLNCWNGTVELKTGKLREHRREDLITRVVPFNYNPAAKCPQWEEHMKTVFLDDADLVRWFQKFCGYALTGLTSEQMFPFLEGYGKNGKSITINVIRDILGEYAGTLPTSTLMENKESATNNEIAAVMSARFVVASEAKEGSKLDEGKLKQMTGGDLLSVRFLHKEWFQAKPKFKLIMTGNSKPRISGTDNGIWRRIRVVRFEKIFNESERVKDFDLKLVKEEAEGILAWMVRGAQMWFSEGLGTTDKIDEWTAEYKKLSDTIGGFIEERVESFGIIKAKEFYDAFKAYCLDYGYQACSLTTFGLRLKARGIEKVHKDDGNYYTGVSLKWLG